MRKEIAAALAAAGVLLAGCSGGSTAVQLPDGTTAEVSRPRSVGPDEVPGTDELQPGSSVAVDVRYTIGSPITDYELDVEARYGAREQECSGAGIAYTGVPGGGTIPGTLYPGEVLEVTEYFECSAAPGERLVIEVSNDSGSGAVLVEMP